MNSDNKETAGGRVVPASEAAIAQAAELIRAGRLVAFPTETVYGLGADATNARAVGDIYAAKGRPSINPLIVHVRGLDEARGLAHFPPLAERLARAFWPGPLTLVLQRLPHSGLADLVSAGLDSVALRAPDNAIAQALLKASGRPIAAPSANRSGRLSPTQAADVAGDLAGSAALILDGGRTVHGLESTVLAVDDGGGTLLRPGAVTAEAIEAVIGGPPARVLDGGERPTSPGQLESHYAPNARIRLGATEVRPGEALLAFGPVVPATDGPLVNLSPAGDLVEAAANLFAALRALDATGAAVIAVTAIPEHGLGEAINDRLRRAAAPRPA
jgi:L-threonylcarbamoyladenylate synthase